MSFNLILALAALVLIIIAVPFLIGSVLGIVIAAVKWVFYSTITAVTYVICFIGRKIGDLFKFIYRKIRDRIYPDEGAYYIKFGPKNRKGRYKIKFNSNR